MYNMYWGISCFSCCFAQWGCLDATIAIKIPKGLTCCHELPLDPGRVTSPLQFAVPTAPVSSGWPCRPSSKPFPALPSLVLLLPPHLQLQCALCSTSCVFSLLSCDSPLYAFPVELLSHTRLLQLLAGLAVSVAFAQTPSCSAACLCQCSFHLEMNEVSDAISSCLE